jgi:small subunit ribosomal protein S21
LVSFFIGCVDCNEVRIFAPAFIKTSMLIIEVKDNESIDRALKKYKRKFERSGVMKQLRKRKQFTKPSVQRRNQLLKAEYKLQKYGV